MLFTFVDNSTLQGARGRMSETVDVSKPLKKITTTINKGEDRVYMIEVIMIEFIFEDGSYQRMGKFSPGLVGGRSQTIEFANGEIFIGARFHHGSLDTRGIEWITGRYAQ